MAAWETFRGFGTSFMIPARNWVASKAVCKSQEIQHQLKTKGEMRERMGGKHINIINNYFLYTFGSNVESILGN